jgi:radical SAM superfamily enzyme YgiQ (UPF0313 family)
MILIGTTLGIGLFSEYNIAYKRGKPGSFKIALVYPSTYAASISNLFTHIAYYYLTQHDDIVVDRFTLDNPTKGAITGIPLKDFDVALISIGYELDLLYYIRILIKNFISPRKRDKRPILIAGGPPIIANPEPALDLFDGVFIGEGEALLEQLIRNIDVIDKPRQFTDNLELYHKDYPHPSIKKYFIRNLDNAFIPIHQIQSEKYEPIYGRGYIIEISRGCKWLCGFCMESHVFHPFRVRSLNIIERSMKLGIEANRVNRIIFYSLSFFDHPHSDKILKKLVEENIQFSLPSIRYNTLNKNRVDLIREGGQKTITIAPETLSERIGCELGKCIMKDHLNNLCSYILNSGLNLKLYFILGLPGDSPETDKLIAEFVKQLIEHSEIQRPNQIRLSINPLIPKPHTPTQYIPLIRKDAYLRRIKHLKKLRSIRVRLEYLDWRWAFAQAIISLGGRKTGELIIRWATEGTGLGALRKAIKELNYSTDYVFKPKEIDDPLPWDHVKLGTENIVRARGRKLLDLYLDQSETN